MATPPTFSSGSILTAAQMNQIGLWLVKTQTVSAGISSINVTSVFSSDFDSYKIIMSGGAKSTNGNVSCSLIGISSGYYSVGVYSSPSGSTVSTANDNNTGSWTWVGGGDTNGVMAEFDLHNPNLATYKFLSNTSWIYTGASNPIGTSQGYCASTTQATGFSLGWGGTSSGTGTIRVYGYRK